MSDVDAASGLLLVLFVSFPVAECADEVPGDNKPEFLKFGGSNPKSSATELGEVFPYVAGDVAAFLGVEGGSVPKVAKLADEVSVGGFFALLALDPVVVVAPSIEFSGWEPRLHCDAV